MGPRPGRAASIASRHRLPVSTQDFKVIDYKSKLLRELAREGWVHDEDGEDELVKLVEGLSDAVYLYAPNNCYQHSNLALQFDEVGCWEGSM
jgi:hypothetical protein